MVIYHIIVFLKTSKNDIGNLFNKKAHSLYCGQQKC